MYSLRYDVITDATQILNPKMKPHAHVLVTCNSNWVSNSLKNLNYACKSLIKLKISDFCGFFIFKLLMKQTKVITKQESKLREKQ